MRVLVTGGAGYIGSHTVLQLLRGENEVLVYDNFSTSSPESLRRVRYLSGKDCSICVGDVEDEVNLNKAFSSFRPDVVIHFAGLKAVGESSELPLHYYAKNLGGSVQVLKAMQRYNCKRIVFSSSATVYGEAKYIPCDESHPIQPTNPYGRSKYFSEEVIRDWTLSWCEASAVILRYFNPVGADFSGMIGEDPKGIPTNLSPYISQVAIGALSQLCIFGGDYDTRDGTGERDYIHVEDLALAHIAAIDFSKETVGCEVFNVGTGEGATVLEMVSAFEEASGREIPYSICSRRAGDVARSVASVEKARYLLGWKARLSLSDMCSTSWRWQSTNPEGYRK